jgi:hypothetical protein
MEESAENLNQNKFFYLLDITPCGPLKVNRRFRGTRSLHLQGRRISQAKNQREEGSKLQAAFLLGLFFDPENDGEMLLRNVGRLLTNYIQKLQRFITTAVRTSNPPSE